MKTVLLDQAQDLAFPRMTALLTDGLHRAMAGDLGVMELIEVAGQLNAGGKPHFARELYHGWIKYNPMDTLVYAIYFNYGTLLMCLNDFYAAKDAFSRSIKIKPDFSPAYDNLGFVLERLGMTKKAFTCWREVSTGLKTERSETETYKHALEQINRIPPLAKRYTLAEVCAELHEQSPYADFDLSETPLDLRGWDALHPIFTEIINRLQPREIIEVGTWKGGRAVFMANLAKDAGIPVTLLCVDTWLGSSEHWYDAASKQALNLKHGFPMLYPQFLANVIHSGYQDTIFPFPIASAGALTYLKHRSVCVDLIYLDASYEYGRVMADIQGYWDLLRPGGILMGNSFVNFCPGVMQAVKAFSEEHAIQVTLIPSGGAHGAKWLLFK